MTDSARHLRRLSMLVALVWAVLAAIPRPVRAQTPNGSKADEMRKKLAEAQQAMKSRLQVISAKSAAEDAGTDPESGLQRNLFYTTTPHLESGQKRKIRQCLDPPQDRLGSYSIAVVRFDDPDYVSPAEFGGGTSMPDIVLDKDEYLNGLMTEHAPAPRQEGRPGVRMVFDLGPEEWDYALGGGWDAPSKVESHLDSKFADTSLEIQRDTIGEAVCTVVEHFERFLARTSDQSPSTFFQIREYQSDLEQLRDRLQNVDPTRVDERGGRPPDSAVFDAPRARAADLLDAANRGLIDSDLETAKSKLDEAKGLIQQLESDFETLQHHAGKSERAPERVEERSADLGFRAAPAFPGGERISKQLESCRRRAEQYRAAFEEGADFGSLDDAESRFDTCLEEVDRLAEATAGDFRLWVYQVPAAIAVLLVVVGGWRAYRRAQKTSTVEYRAESAREEWHRRLPALQQRLDALSDRHPEILTEAGTEDNLAPLSDTDVERIDLAFALAARAHQILDEADRTVQFGDGSKKERLERTRRLLQDETSELTPENTENDTRLGDGLDRNYTFDHGELLDDLETLVDEADERLGSAQMPSGHW